MRNSVQNAKTLQTFLNLNAVFGIIDNLFNMFLILEVELVTYLFMFPGKNPRFADGRKKYHIRPGNWT